MRNLIIILFSLTFPVGTHADIYKFYDENGNVVFADQPGPDAELIEEKELQTIKSPRIRTTTKLTDPNAGKKVFLYEEVKITKPEDGENIRANDGEVNVDITIKPPLKKKLGHKLVLLLDGEPVTAPGTATAFALGNIDRGQHSLIARVIGKKGETVKSSDSVTIHIKRFSIQHPKPQPQFSAPPGPTIPSKSSPGSISPTPLPKPAPTPIN